MRWKQSGDDLKNVGDDNDNDDDFPNKLHQKDHADGYGENSQMTKNILENCC